MTSRITPPPSPNLKSTPEEAQRRSQSQSGFDAEPVNGGEKINMLVAKKSIKKRIQLTQMSNAPSAFTLDKITNGPVNPAPSPGGQPPKRANGVPSATTPLDSLFSVPKSRQPSHSASPAPSMRGFDADIEMGGPMDMDVPIDAIYSSSPGVSLGKRKASFTDGEDRPARARTLGGDRPRERITLREIYPQKQRGMDVLPMPPVLTVLNIKVEGTDDILEGRNSEGDGSSPLSSQTRFITHCTSGPAEVVFMSGKQTQWLDYLPSPIIALTATSMFCAVASQDGLINVYSCTGRRSAISKEHSSSFLLSIPFQNVAYDGPYFSLRHHPWFQGFALTIDYNRSTFIHVSI